ncbi:MAG: NADH-quinone oxidoreductase subunit N, partial [Pseudomonadota bacterium]
MIVEDIFTLAPELFLALSSMVLLVFGVSSKKDRTRQISMIAVGTLLVALVLLLTMTSNAPDMAFGGSFANDTFGVAGRGLVFIGAIVALFISTRYFERESLTRFEYPILVLLACVGMGGMVTAHDLITLYMGIELQSLSLYIMAALNGNSRR